MGSTFIVQIWEYHGLLPIRSHSILVYHLSIPLEFPLPHYNPMRITFQSHHEITTLNHHRSVVKSPWILPKGHQLGRRPIWPSCSLGVFLKTGAISLRSGGWSGKLISPYNYIYICFLFFIYLFIYLSIYLLYFIYVFLSFIELCLICLFVDIRSW